MKQQASQLIDLLRLRHQDAVFVDECKNGPSQQGSFLRFDAWVMEKKWARPNVIIYEVKVDRSDFINDNKWVHYLDYCNQFFFVTPEKVIRDGEVPEKCGHLQTSLNCTRLYQKKKAPHRDVEIPQDVFRYILMCRARVTKENWNDSRDSVKGRLEDYIERLGDRYWGHRYGKRLGERIAKEIANVAEENRLLKAQNERLAEAKHLLKELGVDRNYISRYGIEHQVEMLKSLIPPQVHRTLERANSALTDLLDEIKQKTKEHQDGLENHGVHRKPRPRLRLRNQG